MDNPFDTPVTGQADWDSGLGANFQAIERGYHVSERVGVAVNTGNILCLTSSGWLVPWDVNSTVPALAMAYTAALSGETVTALAWGISRSLSINSVAIPGQLLYGSATTPGLIATSPNGAPIGVGLTGNGILFNPAKTAGGGGGGGYTPTYFTSSLAINAVVGSLHTFTTSFGAFFGDNRRLRVNGSSASHVELKLFSDSARTKLQYQTFSGGISAVNSFNDRAGFPIDTDSGTIYGTLSILSGDVSSDTISVQGSWRV